jgi:hypothetical protein
MSLLWILPMVVGTYVGYRIGYREKLDDLVEDFRAAVAAKDRVIAASEDLIGSQKGLIADQRGLIVAYREHDESRDRERDWSPSNN